MPTYVLVRNNLVVSVINGKRDLTTAESANGGVRREVTDGVTITIGGAVTLTGGKVSACTDPDALSTAESRREQVKQFLRLAEQLPVSNWGLLDNDRATNYWRWLEIIGRASVVNDNLTNATLWGEIEDEIDLNPTEWYKEHLATGAGSWKTLATTTNTWYGTNTGSSWAPKSSAGSMDMTGTWDGLVEYIH